MAEQVLPFTTNAQLDELTDNDLTTELVGWVKDVTAPAEVGTKVRFMLFKFVLTNGQKSVQCLIWGNELINRYVRDITLMRIVHIDGGHCRMANRAYGNNDPNIVPFEIIIQRHTVVQFFGVHQLAPLVPEPAPTEVDFETVIRATRSVAITGFVKTAFAASPSRNEQSTYGVGAITNGTYKIAVHLDNYVANPAIVKGLNITVGEVIKEDSTPIIIMCQDWNNITINEEVLHKSLPELYNGVRIPKRLRQE